jgi:hypothetical protein
LRDVNPEFQQFAVDPRRARERSSATSSESVRARRRVRSVDPCVAGSSMPRTTGSRSSATRDCLRLDDHERCSLVVPEPKQPYPQQAVRQGKPQSRRPRSLKDLQLVPQGAPRAGVRHGNAPIPRGSRQGRKHRHHRGEAYPPDSFNINVRKKNGLFSRHSVGIAVSATTVRTWLQAGGLGPAGTRRG